ncbi:MAG: sugar phosphate isomerase/epimerase [Clostridia bacterium]|nr:sugar phosphate isomerase/epimerase [Clostridia bacterium]
MRLSKDTGALTGRYDYKTAIKMIQDAGFDAFDFSFMDKPDEKNNVLGADYLEKAHDLKAYIDALGIPCNQAHAQTIFTHHDAMDESNEKYLQMVRSLEVASVLGAENIIVHPVASALSAENLDYLDYSREYYRSLIPYCEKFNIHISVENMFSVKDRKIVGIEGYETPQQHIDYVKSLESEWFNICLDVGHCAVLGTEPEDAIGMMDNKLLKSLHIHDNNRRADQHLIPYLGTIHWDKVMEALKKIDYQGDLTFESCFFYFEMPDEMLPTALKLAEEAGRSLIKQFK